MITYTKGNFKYQLVEPVSIKTDIIAYTIDEPLFSLTPIGLLTAKVGYAWDGPSGPTADDKHNIEPSLWHDIMCEMMRKGLIDQGWFDYANKFFKKQLLKKGMNEFRADYYYRAVCMFSGPYAEEGTQRKEYMLQ